MKSSTVSSRMWSASTWKGRVQSSALTAASAAARDEGTHFGGFGGLADGVGHVERVEVARRDEVVNSFEPYVVGVNVEGARPVERPDGGLGGGAHARGARADD